MRRAILLSLYFFPFLAHAECEFKEFFYHQPHDSTPGIVVVTSIPDGKKAKQARAVQMTAAPASDRSPESEEMQHKRKIWAAISKRDLAAFVKLMPDDKNRRRELLNETYALHSAYSDSALEIAKQIQAWEPTLLTQTANSKSAVLLMLARNWQYLDRLQREGYPVDNPPSEKDEVELIKMMLDAGANPDGYGGEVSPLGVIASLPPSPEVNRAAQMLLQRGATIEARDAKNRSPLSFAAEHQNGELVRLMLKTHKPSQRALDEAIVWAPIVGTNQVLAMLLEHGANINSDSTKYGKDGRYFPAQNAASRYRYYGERDLMQLMIRYKADPNSVPRYMDSPLMAVMPDLELMKELLDLGANPNYQNGDQNRPLHLAIHPHKLKISDKNIRPLSEIEAGFSPSVRGKATALLLEYGADPNARDASDSTPLMLTDPGDGASINALIAKGGQVPMNSKQFDYYRQYKAPIGPVSWALVNGNDALASALLARDGIKREDCGAVFYSVQAGANKTLAILLDKKVEAHAVAGTGGMTPLILASKYGRASTVKLLLDRRAAKVNEATPIQFIGLHAANANETTSIPLIDRKGVMGDEIVRIGSVMFGVRGIPSSRLVGGYTALMLAASGGHKAVVEELIKHGADVNQANVAGHTAMYYARSANAKEIVELLKQNGAHE